MFKKSALFLLGSCLFAVSAGISTPAKAAGFYIQEQSVSGLGRSFAGSTAQPTDSSTVYYNPAGMTKLEGAQGQIGVNLLHPTSDFSDNGTTVNTNGTGLADTAINSSGDGGNPYDSITPVPNLYITQQINDMTWVGLGVSAPFGLANKYDEGWFGRYDSIESDLQVIDFAPSVAFKLNDKFSFGFGIDAQYADAKLSRALPDPTTVGGPTAATDGELILEGDSWAVGVNAGLLFEPWEHTRIGAHYRSEVNHTLDGEIKGTTPAAFGGGTYKIGGTADLDLPQMATLAIAHDVNERLTILGHAIWFGWSSFQQIEMELDIGASLVDRQEYENTMAFAIGAEYDVNEAWTVRTGVQYDETPTTGDNRTTRTPDGDRIWLSGGATYNINDRLSLDLAGTYIFIEDGHVDRFADFGPLYGALGGAGTATVTTRGTTESDVGILGLALNYKF